MTDRTVEQIDADLAVVDAALTALLTGTRPQSVKHGEREVSYGSNFTASETGLRRRKRELQVERARAAGCASPVKPHDPFTTTGLG